MSIELLSRPPADWPAKIRWPIQQPEFAEALRLLGYVPYYACVGQTAALIQLRGNWPVMGRLVGRAYAYLSNETPEFVDNLLAELRRRGIPFVRFGNTMWGITKPEALIGHRESIEERFTFVLDTTKPEEVLWKAVDSSIRRAIRSAEKQGVTVREAAKSDDLPRMHAVFAETGERIKQRNHFTAPPLEFYQAILTRMVPAGQAVFYVAEYQEKVIGVILNFVHGDTMLYYAGGSLRDFSKQNAPSLMHLHAIRQCRAHGLCRYDLGGCSPNVPPTDSRYGVFHYKQKWGGSLEKFYNAELYLSPRAKALQDCLRNHIWPKTQTFYLGLKRSR